MTNKALAEQLKLLTEQNSQLLKLLANQPQNVVNLPSLIGGTKEMPRPLKYGQGTIAERSRTNKKGSIYKWYEAKWCDEYGKRHTRTCKTIQDARNVLLQFNKRSIKNKRKPLHTFGMYINEWYATFGNAECGTERNKLNLLQISRIPKEIANKPLIQVTATELQAYLNTIDKPHPKVQSKQLIRACLKHAFNSGLIKSNIGEILKAEVPKADEKQILSREMETKFLAELSPQYRDYAIGLIYTGTRISEFMSLNKNWQTDIDYKNNIVRIRETKSIRQKDIRNGRTFTTREIPLLPEVANIKFPLKTVKKQSVNKAFNRVNEKLGLQITPHCLRHTFISRCNELGITRSVIQSMVGHKTERMTMHYTHNTNELKDREYERLKNNTTISTTVQYKKRTVTA